MLNIDLQHYEYINLVFMWWS